MDSKTLIRMLRADGWVEVRTNSSHVTFKHPAKKKICTVPHPKSDLPIGTANGILKNAELK